MPLESLARRMVSTIGAAAVALAVATTPGGVGCAGNASTLSEVTVGVNWNVLRGRYGTFRTGLQYSNIIRTAYFGVGGTPSAAEDLFMFNFRYIPFE
jgi:hypothetical protein